jgi:hypothetical protein
MPYGGSIIRYDIVTNNGFGKQHIYEWPRGSPSVIRLVQKGFRVFGQIISKSGICMRKISCLHALYQRQTSTWHSDHRKWTWWVYEWGAQVRKYKISKSPHSKKLLSSNKTHNHPITYNQVPERYSYCIFDYFYSKDSQDHKTIQPRPSSNQQDPHRLLFILECNYNRRPRVLPEISRRV